MKIRESAVSSSFIFSHPPKDKNNQTNEQTNKTDVLESQHTRDSEAVSQYSPITAGHLARTSPPQF